MWGFKQSIIFLTQASPFCYKHEVLLEVRIYFNQIYFTSEVVIKGNTAVQHTAYTTRK